MNHDQVRDALLRALDAQTCRRSDDWPEVLKRLCGAPSRIAVLSVSADAMEWLASNLERLTSDGAFVVLAPGAEILDRSAPAPWPTWFGREPAP